MTDFVQLCVPNGMLCSSHCLCMGVCINMFLLKTPTGILGGPMATKGHFLIARHIQSIWEGMGLCSRMLFERADDNAMEGALREFAYPMADGLPPVGELAVEAC